MKGTMAREPDHIVQMRRTLGQGLAALRQAAGLTQGDVARATNCDRSRVAHLERGDSRADVRFWQIADEVCRANGALVQAFADFEAAKADYNQQQHAQQLAAARAEAESFRQEGVTALVPLAAGAHGAGQEDRPPGVTVSPGPPAMVVPTQAEAAEHAWQRLARQADAAIELDAQFAFDIDAEGWSTLTCRHELLNLSKQPISRLSRELWFEHTEAPLRIDPVQDGPHRVAIQRIHDARNLTNFACLVSPAIQPGESAVVGYACTGGQFVSDHYWQQTIVRYVRQFSLQVCHRSRQLVSCIALKDHVDGAQHLLTEGLEWEEVEGDVVMRLTQSHLRPNEIITLRWDVTRESAR